MRFHGVNIQKVYWLFAYSLHNGRDMDTPVHHGSHSQFSAYNNICIIGAKCCAYLVYSRCLRCLRFLRYGMSIDTVPHVQLWLPYIVKHRGGSGWAARPVSSFNHIFFFEISLKHDKLRVARHKLFSRTRSPYWLNEYTYLWTYTYRERERASATMQNGYHVGRVVCLRRRPRCRPPHANYPFFYSMNIHP